MDKNFPALRNIGTQIQRVSAKEDKKRNTSRYIVLKITKAKG